MNDSNAPVSIHDQMAELVHTDWTTIDVNLSLRNGFTLHAGVAAVLRASAATFQFNFRHYGQSCADQITLALTSAVQQNTINKLLESDHVQPAALPAVRRRRAAALDGH